MFLPVHFLPPTRLTCPPWPQCAWLVLWWCGELLLWCWVVIVHILERDVVWCCEVVVLLWCWVGNRSLYRVGCAVMLWGAVLSLDCSVHWKLVQWSKRNMEISLAVFFHEVKKKKQSELGVLCGGGGEPCGVLCLVFKVAVLKNCYWCCLCVCRWWTLTENIGGVGVIIGVLWLSFLVV